jgi:DNA-binding MarR family transcriptional regulator
MNKTVDLVNHWAEFEAKHPNAGIEDFCLYYLSKSREKVSARPLFNGMMPPHSNIVLIKLMDWIVRLNRVYLDAALTGINLKQLDEFILLNAIAQLQEPKKTEAINFSFHELSTGLNLLSSLKCQGYITETDDLTDKRSKRVALTSAGRDILHQCYAKFAKASEIILHDMSEEDIDLCILLLRDIEIKFSGIWQHHKGKTLDEIYQEVVGE